MRIPVPKGSSSTEGHEDTRLNAVVSINSKRQEESRIASFIVTDTSLGIVLDPLHASDRGGTGLGFAVRPCGAESAGLQASGRGRL